MSIGEQHEKLSQAEMEHLRSIVDTYRQTDHGKRIAERDAIDRKAEFVSRLALVLLACAGMATVCVAVWAVMR